MATRTGYLIPREARSGSPLRSAPAVLRFGTPLEPRMLGMEGVTMSPPVCPPGPVATDEFGFFCARLIPPAMALVHGFVRLAPMVAAVLAASWPKL